MKVKEFIKLLEHDGWYLARHKNGHMQFKHPKNRLLVTISGLPSSDIPNGTLAQILRKAGLHEEVR